MIQRIPLSQLHVSIHELFLLWLFWKTKTNGQWFDQWSHGLDNSDGDVEKNQWYHCGARGATAEEASGATVVETSGATVVETSAATAINQ